MDILDKIRPTKEEEIKIKKEINSFVKELKKYIKEGKVVIAGSFAKETWLKGDHDVDLFIKFKFNKYKDKNISQILENRIKKFKFKKIHGSRIYFQIQKGSLVFELVPVLDIKNTNYVVNVMDVSPLHSDYVIKNTSRKLRDEIRLAKLFFKANLLYGAETHKKAFSGYAIEVLVIYYKGFNNLIKATTKWKDLKIIDPKKYYKNKDEVLRLLNKSKLISPLILIDPVQKDRNITAVLSNKNYLLLKKLAKEYLKTKSDKFFVKKVIDINKLKEYIIIEIIPKEEDTNIVGGKLSRSLEYIKNYLDREGFSVVNYGWKWDNKAYFWYKVKNENLSNLKKHFGPKIDDKINLKNFKERWKNYKINIERGRSFVYAPRRYKNVVDFLIYLMKDEFLRRTFKKAIVKKM